VLFGRRAGYDCSVRAEDVVELLDVLAAADVRVWLDGGWGIDALLGEQTREHEDVDVVVELACIEAVIAALTPLGFVLSENALPTRAVLRSPDGRQIDVHPVTFDADGTGWQRAAAPDGSDAAYPADGYGEGSVLGRVVPCLTPELQIAHHSGYEPRERDRVDLARLADRFGVALPNGY
jgi:lincosamide nucleotidyltransferase A/C/D/E